jgi:hypothetical protein
MADDPVTVAPVPAPASTKPAPKVAKVVVEDAPPVAAKEVEEAPTEEYISPQTRAEMDAGKARIADFNASQAAALIPKE